MSRRKSKVVLALEARIAAQIHAVDQAKHAVTVAEAVLFELRETLQAFEMAEAKRRGGAQ